MVSKERKIERKNNEKKILKGECAQTEELRKGGDEGK